MHTSQLKLDARTIMAAKRHYIHDRQSRTPLSAVVALATMQKQPAPVLDTVVTDDHIILMGQLRHTEIYDPVASALRYVRMGVDSIALFTDEKIYSRGMEDLSILSRAVSAPIVYQDYILNEYHVTEARAAGASALVLYASLMDAKELRQVVSITQRWRMTSIVEVNNEEEMATAAALSPHVIGVGMRTVFERERDLEKLSRLRQMTPYNTRFMPLACLETLDDVAAVAAVGVHAVIVDESLLTPQRFGTLLEIIGRPVR